MDAITAVVVWGVIWFVMIWAFPFIGSLAGIFVGGIFDKRSNDDGATLGALLGITAGWVGSVFALIQVILHIISLVKILT